MEEIKLDTQSTVAVPTLRDEQFVAFRKFGLASDFGVPSRNPTTGDLGGVQLYWEEIRGTDPNKYISLGPGYISLNKPGIYHVSCRVTFWPLTTGNSQYLKYIELDLDSPAGVLSDGDVMKMTTNKAADSSFYLSETSLGAGDSGGSSALAHCIVIVAAGTDAAPPRQVAAYVRQESQLLQGQNLTPRDDDNWLEVFYFGDFDIAVPSPGATQALLQ